MINVRPQALGSLKPVSVHFKGLKETLMWYRYQSIEKSRSSYLIQNSLYNRNLFYRYSKFIRERNPETLPTLRSVIDPVLQGGGGGGKRGAIEREELGRNTAQQQEVDEFHEILSYESPHKFCIAYSSLRILQWQAARQRSLLPKWFLRKFVATLYLGQTY